MIYEPNNQEKSRRKPKFKQNILSQYTKIYGIVLQKDQQSRRQNKKQSYRYLGFERPGP
jgi:hypothetical protein